MEKYSDEWLAGQEDRDGPVEAANDESSSNNGRLHIHDAIPQYNEMQAQLLAERLANNETFREARQVLITWIKRGECNESNSASFYLLIKLCHDFVKKLQMEQKECLQKVENAEKNLANQNCLIQCDLNKIGNAFEAIEKQDIWDNFTQIERKNIQTMKEDFLDLEQDNLMDVIKRKESLNFKNSASEVQILRRQTNSMASKLNSLHKKAEDMKAKCQDNENEIVRLRAELERRKRTNSESSRDCVRQNETQIICLISCLLVDHFFDGVSLEYIQSYLRYFFPTINAREIEMLLRRFPGIFEETGFGQDRNWVYVGFEPANPGEWSNMN